ncbi:MAG: chorismate synthase [Candidatus Handelsmanbacteria bacterium]|nr:chorismate synthase [Candidatus Handelsmanbacteria bacterium]
MEILGGPLYGVAGAGESHGPAITTIVFGCPPGLKLERPRLQAFLDRRRPGGNKHGTPRQEADQLVLLSGLYAEDHEQLLAGPALSVAAGNGSLETHPYEEGFTTGEPIAAVVLSAAKRSADYLQFAGPQGAVRPGHADLVKHYKSIGFADPRGGGRSSYRSTISDVIGGSIARLFLQERFGTALFSSIYQVGPLQTSMRLADHVADLQASEGRIPADKLSQLAAQLEAAEIHSLDPDFARQAGELIKTTRQQDDSLGAAVEVVALQPPPLAGEPLYQSLKLRLMGSLGGLHAVQSCEMGAGREAVVRRGSQHNDPIRRQGYQGNHHGGLLGGITTGLPLVFRVGFKPTSTIALPQLSVRKDLEEIDFQLQKGRHDPCVGVRAGITLESRLAIELLNAVLMHQAGRVDAANFKLF